ncbi:MAG: hypothetical protein ACLPUO_10485 [Streptosporangiaceae bacterium]
MPREARNWFTIGRDQGCDLVLSDQTAIRAGDTVSFGCLTFIVSEGA